MSVIKIRNELGQFVDIPALQGEKGDKGDKGDTGATGATGANGKDGVSPNISVKTNNSTQYVLTITDAEGSFDTPNLKGQNGTNGTNGQDGQDGADGKDGVSITSATAGGSYQSGTNTITPVIFNKSDGSNVTVNVQAKNGVDGQDGSQGPKGEQGPQGERGPQGPSGANGTSVTVVQATDENNAISLSKQHPNNVYYWEE